MAFTSRNDFYLLESLYCNDLRICCALVTGFFKNKVQGLVHKYSRILKNNHLYCSCIYHLSVSFSRAAAIYIFPVLVKIACYALPVLQVRFGR